MTMGWACEPRLEDLLRDHTLQVLMRRDGVDEAALRALAVRTAKVLDLPRREEAPCTL